MTAAARPVSIKIDEDAKARDTLKAWEAFCTTGQHVTADEADAWLAQLEQGNDIDPPACHA